MHIARSYVHACLVEMFTVSFAELSPLGAFTACFLLALTFVFILYVVAPGLPRNDPVTVLRRTLAILGVCAFAPFYLWLWSDNGAGRKPIFEVLGIKMDEFIPAALLPLLLVVILYIGPILQTLTMGEGLFDHIWTERYDINLRNYLVAPFAEELIFRACMVPLLLPHLGQLWTVLLCPLFFGLAHMHHLIEWMRRGRGTLFKALLSIFIQVCYTSIFGMFSAFLFIRTGHLVSPFLTHSFCNIMGLPPFEMISQHDYPHWIIVWYFIGLIAFVALLFPFTQLDLIDHVKWW